MKLNIDKPSKLNNNDILITRALYYRYSSWLLGYLMDILKDRALAEEYLACVFKDVPHKLDEFTGADSNPWLCLQQLAKAKLAGHVKNTRLQKTNNITGERERFDSFVKNMNLQQQIVFCGVYYYQKSTVVLADELGIPDHEVKKILKDAFIMIKNG